MTEKFVPLKPNIFVRKQLYHLAVDSTYNFFKFEKSSFRRDHAKYFLDLGSGIATRLGEAPVLEAASHRPHLLGLLRRLSAAIACSSRLSPYIQLAFCEIYFRVRYKFSQSASQPMVVETRAARSEDIACPRTSVDNPRAFLRFVRLRDGHFPG